MDGAGDAGVGFEAEWAAGAVKCAPKPDDEQGVGCPQADVDNLMGTTRRDVSRRGDTSAFLEHNSEGESAAR